MTLNQYLTDNLPSTAMISLKINESETFQYNYWNWFGNSLHLLNNDFRISHIIHESDVVVQPDGGILCKSLYYPKEFILNLYFGGVVQ
jgi:hypothetical protein